VIFQGVLVFIIFLRYFEIFMYLLHHFSRNPRRCSVEPRGFTEPFLRNTSLLWQAQMWMCVSHNVQALIIPLLWGMTSCPREFDSITLSGCQAWFSVRTWYSNLPSSWWELWELPLLPGNPPVGHWFSVLRCEFPSTRWHWSLVWLLSYKQCSMWVTQSQQNRSVFCRIKVCYSFIIFRPARLYPGRVILKHKQKLPAFS
jgi:hypothetical protein